MTEETNPRDDASDSSGLTEEDAVRKDMSYSPASGRETERMQEEHVSDTVDDDIDESQITVAPGSGGPDDTGDVEVDPADIHIPHRSA
jgi:hypothetical protein